MTTKTHTIVSKTEAVTELLVPKLNRKLVLNVVRKPNHNDITAEKNAVRAVTPQRVSLIQKMPPIYDQGDLGSCVANATAAILSYANFVSSKRVQYMSSRMFLYFNGRAADAILDKDPSELITDVGLYMDSALTTIKTDGVLAETACPYDISRFAYKPSADKYQLAQKNKNINYKNIAKTLASLKTQLAAGLPIMIGINVYDNFFSDITSTKGTVGMPNGELLGGHAIVIVGYDDMRSVFNIRNSWGTGWGDVGYGTIPYSYIISNDAYQPLVVTGFMATV